MSRKKHRKPQKTKGHYYDTIRKPPRQGHAKRTKYNKYRRECGKRMPINSAKDYIYVRTCKSKSTFDTHEQALAGAISASRLIGQCRVYKCPYCSKYHLTTHI